MYTVHDRKAWNVSRYHLISFEKDLCWACEALNWAWEPRLLAREEASSKVEFLEAKGNVLTALDTKENKLIAFRAT